MNRQIEEANRICDEGIASDQTGDYAPYHHADVAPPGHMDGPHAKRYRQIKELLKGLSPQGGECGELLEAVDVVRHYLSGTLNADRNRHGAHAMLCGLSEERWQTNRYQAALEQARGAFNKIRRYLRAAGAIESLSQPPRGSVLAEELLAEAKRIRDTLPNSAYVGERQARLLERAADAPKEGWVKEETAWLVEKANKGGVCLGAVERKGKVRMNGVRDFEWTTPHFALRFARKQDAEAFIEAFCHEENDGVIAVEHAWVPPAPTQEGEER